jgi:hypothetical protein
MIETTAAALLVELSVDDPRKSLVALRYVRRHLTPEARWDDRIAAIAGRELLAFEPLDERGAAKAAA